MTPLSEAKCELSNCRNRDQLFNKLSSLCEQAGYQYDYNRSMGSNARCAAESLRYGVAELIKMAERIEARL